MITRECGGTLGSNGWYTSDVLGELDGRGQRVDGQRRSTGCGAQSVTCDTSGTTFTCQATSEGGTNSQSVTVKRDATEPTLTFGSGQSGGECQRLEQRRRVVRVHDR